MLIISSFYVSGRLLKRQLCARNILTELRARHEKGEKWAGIDVFEGKVKDMENLEVYEPLVVKKQIIRSATEAATMILKIDDIIASGKTKMPPTPPGGPGGMPPAY